MANDAFFTEVVKRKQWIDSLVSALRSQIADKAQRIRENPDDPQVSKWQGEMSELQQRLHDEPEARTRSLCEDIEKATGAKDVFKRNTDATNQGLKGEAWAKFVLAGTA